jgi:hypothetical protein
MKVTRARGWCWEQLQPVAGTSPPRHRPGVVLRDTTASCATPHGVLYFAYIESESSKKHSSDMSSQNDASSMWPIGVACRHAAGCVLKQRPPSLSRSIAARRRMN